MSAYTPGPWFMIETPAYLGRGQFKDGRERLSDPITIASDAHTEEIATVWTYLLPTDANARLIAAAPEMLEALQLLSTCEVGRTSLYDEEGVEGWRWIAPDGREWTVIGAWNEEPPMPPPFVNEAIAKALGKQMPS